MCGASFFWHITAHRAPPPPLFPTYMHPHTTLHSSSSSRTRRRMVLETRITRLFGIQHPVIQGGMHVRRPSTEREGGC